MKKYNAVIIDDEALARNDLKELLSVYDEITITGEADSADSAVELINQLSPDIVFLDIQMPGKSGFDVLGEIKPGPEIIFVTAYDEYAVRAFEVNAKDYILKPVTAERLAGVLENLENSRETACDESKPLDYNDYMFIMINNNYTFVKVNEVVKIAAANYYTEITTASGKTGLVSKSMKEWESRLPQNVFCRIHRSTIVNLEYIEKIEEWFNYSYRVYLRGIEKPVAMSRRYVSRIKGRMG